jgi:hypothetical protein
MPKKQKKIVNKKTKLKNTVNVKINIDNSKRTTGRRATTKAANMQPFANFPNFQPARIQQLEPIKKYNSPDLTKTMDEYQKQFKTYLETTDKNVKDIIEKFDDTLKKNTAPPKPPEESKPGASTEYTTYEGETVLSIPIPKKKLNTYTKDDSNLKVGFSSISQPNNFQINNLTAAMPKHIEANYLIAEVIDEKKIIDDAIKKANTQ